MSVVDLIRLREVRGALDPLVDVTRRRRTFHAPTVVPSSNPRQASVIGVAFDYALRFMLQRHNPGANARGWVAERSASKLVDTFDRFGDNPPAWAYPLVRIARRASCRVLNARTFLRKHLKRRAVDRLWLERLAVHALKLARLDPYYRSGYFDEKLVVTDEPAMVSEVVALLQLAPLDRLSDVALWLNPTFGRYSDLVNGADADIIAGDRLIELKTRSQACVERDDVRQLLVYSMLVDLARTDGVPFSEIKTIQVYFARQAEIVSFDLGPARSLPHYKIASDVIIEKAIDRYAARSARVAMSRTRQSSHVDKSPSVWPTPIH